MLLTLFDSRGQRDFEVRELRHSLLIINSSYSLMRGRRWLGPDTSAVRELSVLDKRRPTWDNIALSGGGNGLGFFHPRGGVDCHAPVAPGADLHVLGRQLDDVLFPSVGVGNGVGGAVRELHLSINDKRANQGYGTYGNDAGR